MGLNELNEILDIDVSISLTPEQWSAVLEQVIVQNHNSFVGMFDFCLQNIFPDQNMGSTCQGAVGGSHPRQVGFCANKRPLRLS